jgi:DNA-binding transcriptional MerR regulator
MKPPAREQLPIRTVCALTGVSPMTLRAWERRYGWIRPLRTPKGHRLYTHEHVELIRRALALVERGVPIGQVGGLIESESRPRAQRPGGAWGDYLDGMATAIARFDERELDRIYDQALSFHPIQHVTRNLLMPLLGEVGERWRTLRGGVAEEHFFATYIRSKLGARLQHRMRYSRGTPILATCAPGERHEIGILLFALEAHEAGMRTVLLGADTPLEELVVARQRCGAGAIVLSSTMDPPAGFLERDLARFVRKAGVPVLLGGPSAVRHRRAVSAAGAVAAGAQIEDGVRLLLATLRKAGTES